MQLRQKCIHLQGLGGPQFAGSIGTAHAGSAPIRSPSPGLAFAWQRKRLTRSATSRAGAKRNLRAKTAKSPRQRSEPWAIQKLTSAGTIAANSSGPEQSERASEIGEAKGGGERRVLGLHPPPQARNSKHMPADDYVGGLIVRRLRPGGSRSFRQAWSYTRRHRRFPWWRRAAFCHRP